jgi:hypothetical protein
MVDFDRDGLALPVGTDRQLLGQRPPAPQVISFSATTVAPAHSPAASAQAMKRARVRGFFSISILLDFLFVKNFEKGVRPAES